MSIGRLITRRARHAPDEVLVVDDATGEVLTARELDRHGNRLARRLIALGVRHDDLVTVAMPTSVAFVVTCAAVWKAGATPQPVDPDVPAEDRRALELAARPALVVGARPVDPTIAWIDTDDVMSPQAMAGQSDEALPDVWASSWKAPSSSGSTGAPKVVRATAPARFDPDRPVAPFLPGSAVQWVAAPLWHSASFTYAFRGLMTDHRVVLGDRFDEHDVGRIVGEHRITWTLLSPSRIRRLVRLPRSVRDAWDLRSLETVLHLGAPCPVADKRELIDWLGPGRVLEVYAGSESNGLTMIDGHDWLTHPGSVGRPVGDTEIRVRRDDGSTADVDEPGEIWMRRGGPARYEYLGAGTSQRDADGWDCLGDIGSLDADGYLTVLDRRADVVTCGGHTVYPSRLESLIAEHPAVREAVVFGTPAREDGAGVSAIVDIGDAQIGRSSVAAYTRERLADTHCGIDRVIVGRTPIRNAAGKVRRAALAGDHPGQNRARAT